jgi:hypothetical protein
MNASSRIPIPASVWVGSLWLRAGLVGALGVALGVAGLLRDEASAVAALATVAVGAVLAFAGFRRARHAFDSDGLPAATSRRAGGTAAAGTGAAYNRGASARSA